MKVKKIIPFEEFEKAVMHKILGKKNRLNEILLEQYGRARVIKRDFLVTGFFTEFEVPADVSSVTGLGNVLEDDGTVVTAYINDGAFEFIFILFLEDGKISLLEGASYDSYEIGWQETIENYELKRESYTGNKHD